MGPRRALLGTASAVGFARIFSLACAAFQLPLLTRSLTPDQYSSVAIAIAIATYFSLLSAEPVILGFERFPGTRRNRFNYRYALRSAALHLAIGAIVVALVSLPFGRLEYAVAFAGWGMGIAVNRLISLAWLMWEQPWPYAWNLAVGTGTRTAVLVWLVLSGWDPLLSLGVAGSASALAALALSPRLRHDLIGDDAMRRPWAFKFGASLALASLSYAILSNANLLILNSFAPTTVTGKYAAMLQLSTLTSGAVLGLVLTATYPKLRRAWDAGHTVFVQGSLATLQASCLAIAAVTVIVCYAGDNFIVKLVLPAHFVSSPVLAPLIMSTAFATMGGMASWHHQLNFHVRRVAWTTGLTAAFGVSATLVLTALLGERGAAIGALAGYGLYLVAMQKGTRLPTKTIFLALGSAILTSGSLLTSENQALVVVVPALIVLIVSLLATKENYVRSRSTHALPDAVATSQ